MGKIAFDIDKRYNEGELDDSFEPDYTTCVSVSDYEDIGTGTKYENFKVVDPDEIVTKENTIRIMFDYPLNNPVALEFESPTGKGFTRMEFFKSVFDGYTKIYKVEEEDDKDPGNVPGMFNRARSEGRYGIWGHVMTDLYLEGIIDKGCGNFKLAMGS